MVMQVEHRELYWFRLSVLYVQLRFRACITLHLRVLVVGVYKLIAREG